jgi:hypothetical protein
MSRKLHRHAFATKQKDYGVGNLFSALPGIRRSPAKGALRLDLLILRATSHAGNRWHGSRHGTEAALLGLAIA